MYECIAIKDLYEPLLRREKLGNAGELDDPSPRSASAAETPDELLDCSGTIGEVVLRFLEAMIRRQG